MMTAREFVCNRACSRRRLARQCAAAAETWPLTGKGRAPGLRSRHDQMGVYHGTFARDDRRSWILGAGNRPGIRLLDAGIETAPEFSGKKIRYIHVLLEIVERRPVTILNVECGFLQFDESGKVDSAARWGQMQLAVKMVDSGWVARDAAALVEARHLFARREYDHKYRWQPSSAILKKVGEAIFGAV